MDTRKSTLTKAGEELGLGYYYNVIDEDGVYIVIFTIRDTKKVELLRIPVRNVTDY